MESIEGKEGLMNTKQCRKCKEIKELNQFNKDKKRKDGLSALCKDCKKIEMSAWQNLPYDPLAIIRKCSVCELNKSCEEFGKHKSGKDGLRTICRNCAREVKFKNKYGITFEDYGTILKKQKGLCAICFHPEKLAKYGNILFLCVDHCHKTGKIRGLLCNACNRALGLLDDSPDRLDMAASYLRTADIIL